MPFEDLTLEQLRAATKEQIITRVVNILTSMTRKKICEFIWTIKSAGFEAISLSTLTINHDVPEGQLLRVYEKTDILGNKTGSTKTEWTYYPTGEVDTITILELDALDQIISQKTIKHFTDGRQPIILY
jgi:hypothetical protein